MYNNKNRQPNTLNVVPSIQWQNYYYYLCDGQSIKKLGKKTTSLTMWPPIFNWSGSIENSTILFFLFHICSNIQISFFLSPPYCNLISINNCELFFFSPLQIHKQKKKKNKCYSNSVVSEWRFNVPISFLSYIHWCGPIFIRQPASNRV